jgi:orotidine-5'-phosphate decarboxylase
VTKLVLPVDIAHVDWIKDMIACTKGLVDYYKFGSIPFTAVGPALISMGHDAGAKVFLDLKYHDIPNTVAGAAEACVELGVDLFNVHIAGGREMLMRTMDRMRETAAKLNVKPPLVLGVTVLTSFSDPAWAATYGVPERPIQEQVVHFAQLAKDCGLDGVVASPLEIRAVKEECGHDFLVLTPGIRLPPIAYRLPPIEGDDQARTLTPGEAARLGADFIVVGRPITQAPDPARVCAQIRKDLQGVG